MAVNPYQKYKEESVLSMTPGEMVVRLYDEVIKQLNVAVNAMGQKDYEKVNASLQKSQRIVTYLKQTLNFDYEISNNLASLYDFYLDQILKANIKKDKSFIMEIIPLVSEMRDAFAQGEKLARIGK